MADMKDSSLAMSIGGRMANGGEPEDEWGTGGRRLDVTAGVRMVRSLLHPLGDLGEAALAGVRVIRQAAALGRFPRFRRKTFKSYV